MSKRARENSMLHKLYLQAMKAMKAKAMKAMKKSMKKVCLHRWQQCFLPDEDGGL